MKHLFLISALLFSFNGWTNEAYDNCIAIAEEAKNNVLQPTDWSKIEAAINEEEALIPETARLKGIRSNGTSIFQKQNASREAELDLQKEIEQKRIQLEYDKQDDLEKVAKSKREAAKLYVELMKLCKDLK